MITMNEIRYTVQNYIPYDTGKMYIDGTRFSEDSTKFTIIYDGNAIPYIPYQEYGFTHYKSGKFITVNQGFIQNDTVNALNYLVNTATSREKSLILAQSKRTVEARNNQLSQGTLQSIKGNANR
jgi:hypothetical protein